MSKESKGDNEDIKDLIQTGSELTGSIAGSVLGTIIAGVPGAIIGGASGVIVSKVFTKVGLEIKKRFLGNREEIRIGATYTFAISRIDERLKNGENLRDDGFFDASETERAASEEILEGVLLASQREHQEMKVKHYGFLVANIAFDKTIDRGFANYLLRIVENLSYRQLCLMSLIENKDSYEIHRKIELPENEADYIKLPNYDPETKLFSLRAPLKDWKKDLDSELNELDRNEITDGQYSYGGIKMIYLTKIGRMIYSLAELNKIDKRELEDLAEILRYEE